MTPHRFPGLDELVQTLDTAVCGDCTRSICGAVGEGLAKLICSGRFELPEALRTPIPDCYARRLLHSSAEHGYTVIAMTWGAGQGTPIHDHCGQWCVEGVLQGSIQVDQYELLESEGDRFRFDQVGHIFAGFGSSGSLIPPYEYHTIANPGDTPAVTIHVYASEMTHCCIFTPEGDGWHRRHRRDLSYTA